MHTKEAQAIACERLREWLPKGSTVYCIVRSISATGMSRQIQVVYFEHMFDGTIEYRHPTGSICIALDKKMKSVLGRDTIMVKGTGFNQCEALINEELANKLWGECNVYKVVVL